MSWSKVLPALKSCVKTKAFAVILTALVVLMSCLFCFWYHQSVSAYTSIQGFWHITDNVYMLIDGCVVSIIELIDSGMYVVIDKNENADFKYSSTLPLYKHTYKLSFDKKCQGLKYLNASNSKKITFDLFPVVGVMQIIEDDKVVAELTKDNQMSSQYM